MLLYDSFLSLNALTLLSGVQATLFKHSDLDFARKKEVASFRVLANPSRISAYKYFLTCCEQALSDQEEVPLLDVIFNYLSDVPNLSEREACDKLTQLLCVSFKHQHNPLSLASMGLAFVDRPKMFTAFLRYLLQGGVTPEQILSTHLLQNYFLYYLSSLSQSNNPVEKLYHLLSLFEDSAPLSTLAQQVCCEREEFSSYALDGSMQQNTTKLAPVAFIDVPLRFTPTENNLKSLYVIFQVDFLMGALHQWNEQTGNIVWVNTITHLFNQSNTVISQMPLVVNRLHENPLLQQALAKILDDRSLSILVEKHVVGVLNLIPFCPKLVDMVQLHDLPNYFLVLRQQNTSGPALFSSLFAFFNQIKHTDTCVASLVFDALIDSIHIDPYVLEDMRVVGKLRKFPHVKDCINRKVRALEAMLEVTIQLQTNESIADMDSITLEDLWQVAAAKIQHYTDIIVDFDTTFPMDKYKLYTRIASSFVKRLSMGFDLYAFMLALGVEPLFEVVNVTLYERLLIEILATIDNQHVRTHCIQMLDANVTRPWREFNYGGKCLFEKASLAGNLGLIQWMNVMKIRSPSSYDSLALLAAYVNQWSVASYFHVQRSLKHCTVNQLLQIAVSQNSLHAIPALWTGDHSMPDMLAIETQFKLSVQQNALANIHCFVACPRKPRDKVIKAAFDKAIELKYLDIARAIAEGFSGEMLKGAIEQTLKNAARSSQCDVLDVLCTLKKNRPSQNATENALISATRANQLPAIKRLVRHTIVLPRLQVIQAAREEADHKKLTNIEKYLSILYKITTKKQAAFFQNGKNQQSTLSLPALEHPLKHAVSCNAMSPLHRHGFFQENTGIISPAPSLLKSFE